MSKKSDPVSVPAPVPQLPADIRELDNEARALLITDSAGEVAATDLLARTQIAIRNTTAKMEDASEDLKAKLEKTRSPFKVVLDTLANTKAFLNKGLQDYRIKVQRELEAAQRKAIEDANKLKREAEEKERKAREEAEVARKAGDEAKAQKLDAKADTAAAKAQAIVPEVIEQQSKSVQTSTGAVTFTDLGKDCLLPGRDKEKKIYADDPILKDVPKDWLLQHSVLDWPRINNTVKGGGIPPAPFVLIPKRGTQVREK